MSTFMWCVSCDTRLSIRLTHWSVSPVPSSLTMEQTSTSELGATS